MGSSSRWWLNPVDPLEGGQLDGFEAAPRPAASDDLGLVEAVDRLREGVAVAVADAADRGFDAHLGEALGVLDREVLYAAVAVMDQPAALGGPAVMERLLQRVEDEARLGGCAMRATPRCVGRRHR
jgi:hypothetical protein